MPFNAIVLEEREKAIQVAHLSKPYNSDLSDFGAEYCVFWIPRKVIYRIKKVWLDYEETNQKCTNTGKPIVRIYYSSWATNLVRKAFENALENAVS